MSEQTVSASPAWGQADGVPLFPDVGVIALVPEPWGGPWQLRHHFLVKLARYFSMVWVDPHQEWRHVWSGESRASEREGEPPPANEGFWVHRQEWWLPKLYRPEGLARFTEGHRLRRARRFLLGKGCRRIVLYLWRPEFDVALEHVPHDLSCYHIDDEYSFAPVEQPLDQREAQLIARVNRVFIHSNALMNKKGRLNPHTLKVPNGVDYAAYVRPCPEPDDLRAIPHPRIGYVGKIKAQLDLRLLRTLALKHPDWAFVFIGPKGFLGNDAALCDELFALSNVHYLGGKGVKQLPAYTQHVDVCLLSYQLDGYTKFIYPLKLHEYFASGRPVVGVPIPALEEFRGLLRMARTADEWSSAIAASLDPGEMAVEKVAVRRAVARQHDWNILVHRVAGEICAGLKAPYCERFNQLNSEELALSTPQ